MGRLGPCSFLLLHPSTQILDDWGMNVNFTSPGASEVSLYMARDKGLSLVVLKGVDLILVNSSYQNQTRCHYQVP